MASSGASGNKGAGTDPARRYMAELNSSLLIRDPEAREQILGSVRKVLAKSSRKANGYEGLVAIMGSPRELGSRLSDSRNWTVQMGTPLMPKVPLEPAISPRGRMMIAAFITAMFVVSGVLFIVLPSGDLEYPVMLLISAIIYLLLSSVYYGFIGYSLTYRSLKGSGVRVETCRRSVYDLQLISSVSAVLVMDAAMVLYPFVGGTSGLIVSITLGVPPLVLGAAVLLMAVDSRGSLPGPGAPMDRSGEVLTKNKK